jgi:hypothetical protein
MTTGACPSSAAWRIGRAAGDRQWLGRRKRLEAEDLGQELRHEVRGDNATRVLLVQAVEGRPQRLADAEIASDLVAQLKPGRVS